MKTIDTTRIKPLGSGVVGLPSDSPARRAARIDSEVACAFEELNVPLDALEKLCLRGLRRVVFTQAIDDMRTTQGRFAFLRVLRDLTSCNIEVLWNLGGGALSPTIQSRLLHLAPPEKTSLGICDRRWLTDFRFGSLYWRKGPNFIFVRDSREDGITQYVLDDSSSQAVFLRFITPASVDRLPAADATSLESLVDCGLVIVCDGYALTLPYRMKHWPVPFRAV